MIGQQESQWTIKISCPRPRPRVSKQQQEWHLQRDRIARTCAMFFGPDASIELTARTATLHYQYLGTGLGTMPETLQGRFAMVLQGMYFDMEMVRLGDYRLPRPVRTSITEHAHAEQTSPSKGDQVT